MNPQACAGYMAGLLGFLALAETPALQPAMRGKEISPPKLCEMEVWGKEKMEFLIVTYASIAYVTLGMLLALRIATTVAKSEGGWEAILWGGIRAIFWPVTLLAFLLDFLWRRSPWGREDPIKKIPRV